MNFTLEIRGEDHYYRVSKFPGGEINVQLSEELLEASSRLCTASGILEILIAGSPNTSDKVMELHLLKDALDQVFKGTVRRSVLVMPYVPYQQQDRVCNEGEAHSSKVFCNTINSMCFDDVAIMDPHSDVVGALLNNVTIMEQHEIWEDALGIFEDLTLVSPDAGSLKKIHKVAQVLGKDTIIRADKLRDVQGNIIETIVHAEAVPQKVAIVDDICVGGKTFIELAKVLKQKGAEEIHLFVTHGVFSNGVEHLLENGVDYVYTTTTLPQSADRFGGRFTVFEI